MARFPILGARDDVERGQEYPRSVTWSFALDGADQAKRNHNQTLSELASRGGLSPAELWCAIHGVGLREGFKKITAKGAIEWLKEVDGAAVDWLVR